MGEAANKKTVPLPFRILRSIWAVYGVLFFVIGLITFFPIAGLGLLLFRKKAHRFLIGMGYRFYGRLYMWAYLIFYKNHGKDKIPRDRAYVIVSNHQSQVDILVNAGTSPVLYKFLSKAEVGKIPILGFFARNLCILVDRKTPASRTAAMESMATTLENGFSVLLYPEGTRNRTPEPLKEMYDGAFRLAIQTQKPILVTTLVGSTQRSLPTRVLDLAPGMIHVYWDQPIETTGMTMEDLPVLKKRVQDLMLGHLE